MTKRTLSHKEHIEQLNRAIHIENITIAYGDHIILQNTGFQLAASSMLALIAPFGAGKTTLLKTILGMVKPLSGYVYIFSRPTKTLINDIAFVPARYEINWNFPINLKDLVMMSRYNFMRFNLFASKEDKDRVAESLELLELDSKKKISISELTDEERQRAIVARAIAQDARIILLDEPFSINHIYSQNLIIKALEEQNKRGKSIIIAHHDMITIPNIFNQIILIKDKKIISGISLSSSGSKNIPFINDTISTKDIKFGIPKL